MRPVRSKRSDSDTGTPPGAPPLATSIPMRMGWWGLACASSLGSVNARRLGLFLRPLAVIARQT
jgi:hypothetical protein